MWQRDDQSRYLDRWSLKNLFTVVDFGQRYGRAMEPHDDDFYESEQYVTSPVLWVSTNRNLQAPFGITCYL